MMQQQPILPRGDIALLRESLEACPERLNASVLLTSVGALPFNVSALDNAQVFTTRAHGTKVFCAALQQHWSELAGVRSDESEAMQAAATAADKRLMKQARDLQGPAATSAAAHVEEGSVAIVAALKSTLRPLETLATVIGTSTGLLATQQLPQVQSAEELLRTAAQTTRVLLAVPAEPNVYHLPLQVPAAVQQAALQALGLPHCINQEGYQLGVVQQLHPQA
jgi:hypothetical protein